jgi:phosphopantetheinyl transferase (holo-ACP synthase)
MFITDTTIDAVQTAKKSFVNTVFANNEAVAKALNGFVDAQSEYTKKAIKAGTDTATQLTSEMVKLGQEAAKFDYTKVAENFSKAFTVKK